ncbi:uncharacterized protein LOC135397822 [Ornithodoros turicata]|uniref:uncharacterized protein LOC135397822 n=1 Tax=Ornithodoros turicata TaxID=34597 RepID=UPI003139406E
MSREADEEDILRKYVTDLHKDERQYCGYLDVELFNHLQQDLLTIGVSFVTESSQYKRESEKSKLAFSMNRGSVPISLDTPFRVLSVVEKGCLFGENRHNSMEQSPSQPGLCTDWTPSTYKQHKQKLQGTKKKGCSAKMHLKTIELFPDFQVNITAHMSQYAIRVAKQDALAGLSDALSTQRPLASKKRMYFTMTRMSQHTNHEFDEFITLGQTVDRRVIQRVKDLASEGVTSVTYAQTCIKYYVEDVLFAGKPKPSSDCRAFFPTKQDIANYIQTTLRENRASNIDQENVTQFVNALRESESELRVLFRPYQKLDYVQPHQQNSWQNKKQEAMQILNENTESVGRKSPSRSSTEKTDLEFQGEETSTIQGSYQDNVEITLQKEFETTLLFCYQSPFMAGLLEKYGSSVVCLDATNKTTDYLLPLFFIVVKTAISYMIAGAFIVQFETSACIAEALQVFKQWCPMFSPQYWMVDYSDAEISAINSVFPKSAVMLCDFHREQAWDRWLRRKENGVINREGALSHLRKLAHATTREEFEKAYKDLSSSCYWTNHKFRRYIETEWLPVSEKWVRLHRLAFDTVITTNNGIEAQSRLLKEHLKKSGHGKRSLYGLLCMLVRDFFPQRKEKCQTENRKRSSKYRLYHEHVPEFLHNRPPKVATHIMNRMLTAEDYMQNDVKVLMDGNFSVKSSDPTVCHTVNFAIPSCTCLDFKTHNLPCKYFCVVFRLFPGEWGFEKLPDGYRNGPHLTLDSINTCATVAANVIYSTEVEAQADGETEAIADSRSASELLTLPSRSNMSIAIMRRTCREKMDRLRSLTFYCTDPKILEEVGNLLDRVQDLLTSSTPSTSGVVTRASPTKGCSGTSTKKRKINKSVQLLALARRRARLQSSTMRHRVGQRADILRHTVNVPLPL